MSFKRFLNSHFVFGNKNHISFFQGSSFRFAVINSVNSSFVNILLLSIPFCAMAPDAIAKKSMMIKEIFFIFL